MTGLFPTCITIYSTLVQSKYRKNLQIFFTLALQLMNYSLHTDMSDFRYLYNTTGRERAH